VLLNRLAEARDCVTASLHDSAPGQLVTSAIESASAGEASRL
jgi:hypothetical protein